MVALSFQRRLIAVALAAAPVRLDGAGKGAATTCAGRKPAMAADDSVSVLAFQAPPAGSTAGSMPAGTPKWLTLGLENKPTRGVDPQP